MYIFLCHFIVLYNILKQVVVHVASGRGSDDVNFFFEGGVLSYIFAVRNDDTCLSIRRSYSPLKAELFFCDLSAVQVI